ncbi:FAD-dependent tricarballylate dehydrogenase TcuA [Micromonospora sp. WMMD1128]|uniref:FAD-dependent tricarballylate dehydrogenase TcuA n=1 Tax=Micromonospora sp. WMMD1128 TaxID=3015150 RepID=UPI00248CAABE|nr:FAD-dependent tricarballylate dehydrogenase TcuA [Micromonospora sp. WMMD1128]WBB75633.1 FAD-dependent tricarballylate dehydrogenase TcuA [Micromonospora sp. WMMD1128]
MSDYDYDVLVVGAGNAAFSAAHAAREQVSRVGMLEKATTAELGGNSYFTLGSFRATYHGLDDLRPILSELDEREADRYDLDPYPVESFAADMLRLTRGRTDPTLMRILVEDSFPTLRWLHGHGVKFKLQSDNQVFEVNGRKKFWGGGTIATVGGGIGLIEQHLAAAKATGIDVRAEHQMTGFLVGPTGAVEGVVCRTPQGERQIRARAVVLASGGFEADARLRAVHLGPGWDTAKVRGSRHNTGEGLMSALGIGAQAYGNWSGAHAVAWDINAGPYGNRVLTNKLQRHSYPFGITVNVEGDRFVDEGADFRNYTYAKIGSAILRQTGGLAYQIFDQRGVGLLRTDYGHDGASQVVADSIRELAEKLDLNPDRLERTISGYNASVGDRPFDPTVLDGLATSGLQPPKSNWAQPIDRPPYVAFPVGCAITFTYGGVRVDEDARVLNQADQPIPGLHAAGEVVGGLFYDNYPGGSGLMSGAVFGRRAGRTAARHSRDRG